MTTTATIDDRAQLAQALKNSRAAYDQEYPGLQATVAEAMRERRAVQERFEREAGAAERKMAIARRRMLDLDEARGTAEFALRRSADPRLVVLRDVLNEWWDRVRIRGGHEAMDVMVARDRVRTAVARLEALQVDVKADVDAELKKILDVLQIAPGELFYHGWRP